MKIGILSDVHGNLEALTAVLDRIAGTVDEIMVLGDVVGYGPDPVACLEALSARGALFIRGNHEEGVGSGDLSRFRRDARISLEWTRERVPAAWRERLSAWPFKRERFGCVFVHGGPADPLFGYVVSREDAVSGFAALDGTVCFHGHTHFPLCFVAEPGADRPALRPADPGGLLSIRFEPGRSYLVNVGSVGQPRDGLFPACAGIFDTEERRFELLRVAYPAEVTRDKIVALRLPSSLGGRLLRGV